MKDIAQKSSYLERRNFVLDLAELKTKLAMSSRMLFNAGLVDYSGHISVRIPGSDHLLILPHPVSRATVKPDDMVITDFEGKLIEGKYKAPSEVYMHARAYKARGDVQSVAHLHNHMVATLSMVDKPFYPASSNPGAFFGPGALPKYMDPALIHTNEQGDAVAKVLGTADAVMLRGHGPWLLDRRSSGFLPVVWTWKKPHRDSTKPLCWVRYWFTTQMRPSAS